MNHIDRKSRQALRRMLFARFLSFTPLTLGTMLTLAAVGILLPKVIPLNHEPAIWVTSWLTACTAIGLIVTCTMTWMGRSTLADAAAEIDHRFGLRERLSSALWINNQQRQTELGQALLADADRRAESLDIPDRFKWGFDRRQLLLLAPLLLSLSYFYLPDRQSIQAEEPADILATSLVQEVTQPLLEQIRKKREEAEKDGLTDALDIYKKIEADLEKLRSEAKLDSKQALAKLNEMKEQLNERRKELGNADALKKNLQNMEKFENGPADKLSDALKQGDLDKAEEALRQLMECLKNDQLDSEQLDKLQKQLEQIEQSLKQAAQDRQEAMQKLEEQIQQAQKSGDNQRAGELQRKLDQMQAGQANMGQLQELAEMMSQCQECMGKGDADGMQKALDQMASKMKSMKVSAGQLQDLDQLMDKLGQCKSGMCQGQKPGTKPGNGQGMGAGKGEGLRPEEEADVDFFDSQVRDQMKLGETVFGGKIGGENRKGISRVQVQEQINKQLGSEPEPLDDTPLPRTQRDHVRDYYNTLRDGKE